MQWVVYHLLNVDRYACEVTVFHCHLNYAAKSLWIIHAEEREGGNGVSVCKCNWILLERISLLLVEIGYLIQHSRVDSSVGIPSDS